MVKTCCHQVEKNQYLLDKNPSFFTMFQNIFLV